MSTSHHEKRTAPCSSCPFLRSAPLAYWHPDEYTKLFRMEMLEKEPSSTAVFSCHKERSLPASTRRLCAGWMIDQKRKNIPSLALRLLVRRNAAVAEQLRTAAAESGAVYGSVGELVQANADRDREIHPYRYAEDKIP